MSFSFRATTNGYEVGSETFFCSLDGAAFAQCASPLSYVGLAPGAHTFAVWGRDVLGNEDPTPTTHTWAVGEPPDTLAPTVTIAAPEALLFNVPGVLVTQLEGTAIDDRSGVEEVSVRFTSSFGEVVNKLATLSCNDERTSCAWTVSPPSATGRWRATALGVDKAGNRSGWSDAVEFFLIGSG